MARQFLSFPCEGAMLAATLDRPEGAVKAGLLIVTGGNELRSGAFNGQAQLADALAQAGYAVLRYDRRGVGDSEGENGGFRSALPDIAAAMQALRSALPDGTRIIAHGNCDAATSLMLAAGGGADGLVLSNPWPHEGEEAAAPSVAVLRSHYRQRLMNWGAIKRLLTGQVNLSKLLASLMSAAKPTPAPPSLVAQMRQGLEQFDGPVRILLAQRDATAQAFLGLWDKQDQRLNTCPDATHAFVESHARIWLTEHLIAALDGG
ncbi:hydrolase 1, exosortase A system-associated [Novosphingobium umbonatum]|uniref:Hydrolase 1, exosortase A system-associated n=1 Tax=Novosphingobium umbonatum TaxID=1908524 RepID=A0A437N126_9SPHN|nr:hydrolase 1, exosortase A system-associated [Novosphingobium umbonatum]RVU03630.1 hydrolase 1, exosortase A system-associated [Novosphingobium umbonatum]